MRVFGKVKEFSAVWSINVQDKDWMHGHEPDQTDGAYEEWQHASALKNKRSDDVAYA